MKRENLWFCIIAAVILVIMSVMTYNNFMIYYEGDLVDVTVTRMPLRHSNSFMYFEMDGQPYHMNVDAARRDTIHVGSRIQLKYSREVGSFLFPDDNPIPVDVTLLVTFVGLGGYMAYKGLRRESS